MDSKKLSARKKQPGHDRTFEDSEHRFATLVARLLPSDRYAVQEKPRDLAKMIPGPDGRAFGVVPEVSVANHATGRKLFFEVKKQGDAGNADERACKHHTVEFQRRLRAQTGFDYHSFFTVFCESLAVHPRYTSKHSFFFEEDHYFCWVSYDVTALEKWLFATCAKFIDPR